MERLNLVERIKAGFRARAGVSEGMVIGRAMGRISHKRPYDYDEKRGMYLYREVDEPEIIWNLITNVGRAQIHKGAYGTSGLPTNGFNYIALSNDTVSGNETATSTTLSNEITTNGLARAQGTVTLATGAGTQTTVDKTFTATGSQSAQKSALFDASSSGNMNHVLAFTQRSLITNDTLEVTYTLTIS